MNDTTKYELCITRAMPTGVSQLILFNRLICTPESSITSTAIEDMRLNGMIIGGIFGDIRVFDAIFGAIRGVFGGFGTSFGSFGGLIGMYNSQYL